MVLSFISFAESLVQKSSQDRRLKILVSLHWERKFSKFLCCLSFSSLDSGQVKKVVHRVLFCWAVPWCILSRGKRLSLLISDLRVIKISIQQVFIHNRDKGVLERSIVCLFVWALEPSPVMSRPLLRGTASSPRGWHVCNTPSSSEGTLSTPRQMAWGGTCTDTEQGKGGILWPVLS